MMKRIVSILIVSALTVYACSDDVALETLQDPSGTQEIVIADVPEDFESAYQKQVAVWDFTGASCVYCPDGYSKINSYLTIMGYKEIIHPMAFHSKAQGSGDLALEETDQIHQAFRLTSYPAFVTDMLYSGGLGNDSNEFAESIEDNFIDNICHCGVAVSSRVDGTTASVTVKVLSEWTSEYRVALYVVEDAVRYPQLTAAGVDENYIHRHVVRRIVSSSYKGDSMSENGAVINAGEEKTKVYEISLDSRWNLTNTSVYALVIGKDGYVNNMNICSVSDGDSGYKMK
ncbi:MAG: Omp28-related outer membrane protein [Bacteroidales bacterium]|nr:Omp28-related outer membrane protein [Bacteroidales bacterium]